MKIAFLFGAELKLGGQLKSCISLAKEIINYGNEIYFLGYGYNEQVENLLFNNNIKLVNWMPYIEYVLQYNKKNGFVKYSNKNIKKILRDNHIDFLHIQDYESFKDGFYAATSLNIAFLLTIPGGPNDISKVLFNNIPVILYSDEQLKYYTTKISLLRPKVFFLNARIDNSYFLHEKVTDLRNNSIPLKALHAIRIDTDKKPFINTTLNVATILNKLYGTKLTIVGNGDYKSELIDLLIKLNIDSFVQIVPPVYSDDQMKAIMNESDIIIGNGRIVMEAMAMRKPIIIVGENNQFEFVTVNNIEKLKEYNFSGRNFRYNETFKQTTSLEDIKHSLLDIDNIINENFSYAFNNLHARIGANQLVVIYSQIIESFNFQRFKTVRFYLWFFVKKAIYFLFNQKNVQKTAV